MVSFHAIRKWRGTLIVTMIMLVLVIYSWLAVKLNPAPSVDSLKRAEITVETVHRMSPNLVAILPSGERMNFDLPPSGYSLAQGFPGSDYLVKKKGELERCTGFIEYDRMRFMPFKETFRIWILRCGNVSIDFKKV
jgi:hypothetical protein